MQSTQKQQSASTGKKKKSKKRKKKDAATTAPLKNTEEGKKSPGVNSVRQPSPNAQGRREQKSLPDLDAFKSFDLDSEVESGGPEDDELDREVEQFRLLLEKINAESAARTKKKLVLPPETFARLSTMAVS